MQKLLLAFLLIFSTTFANADFQHIDTQELHNTYNISNIDTPITWSKTAIYATIEELYKNQTYDFKVSFAKHLISQNNTTSIRTMCESYFNYIIGGFEDTDAPNCNDFITKLIKIHNMIVDYLSNDTTNQILWDPYTYIEICKKQLDSNISKVYDPETACANYADSFLRFLTVLEHIDSKGNIYITKERLKNFFQDTFLEYITNDSQQAMYSALLVEDYIKQINTQLDD